jgi:hypothetical protein
MFTLRKRFIIWAIIMFSVNSAALAFSSVLINLLIDLVIPTGYYTPEQFVTTTSLGCLGAIILMNVVILKFADGGNYNEQN